MLSNAVEKQIAGNNFNQPRRRVLNKNRSINLNFMVQWNSGETESITIKGITQGYNLQGCGAIFILPNELKSVCEDLIPHIVGKEITLEFDYDDIDIKSNRICGTILRSGKPKTSGYDVFCAIQFDYVPPEISLCISKDLKQEFCDILHPVLLRNNSFEIRKPDYKYREISVIRKLLDILKPYIDIPEKHLTDILIVSKLKKELSKVSQTLTPEEILEILTEKK
ncbi:hypothetical protein KA977_03015 [Candidatus Dependentiae bacterium]|nr:hypothetical protein [Candidatus Dependentiae bacterium]